MIEYANDHLDNVNAIELARVLGHCSFFGRVLTCVSRGRENAFYFAQRIVHPAIHTYIHTCIHSSIDVSIYVSIHPFPNSQAEHIVRDLSHGLHHAAHRHFGRSHFVTAASQEGAYVRACARDVIYFVVIVVAFFFFF